jgi:hypothetical protein
VGRVATDRVDGGSGPDIPSLGTALRRRAMYEDAVAIALVPLFLGAMFTLPAGTKSSLALSYDDPTVVSVYASHFVHFDLTHLLGNIVGYVLVVPTAYVLSLAAGRRRQFFVVFVAFIIGLPVALSALNLIFTRPRVGLGFSGILMAFVGYLPVGLLGVVGRRFHLPVGRLRSQWLFFLGLAVISLVSGPAPYGWAIAGAAGLAGVLFLIPVIEDWDDSHHRRLRTAIGQSGHLEVLLVGLLVFVGYLLVAFPGGTTSDGAIVNVYSHLLGYSLGYVTTYLTVLAGGLDVD